MATRTRKTEEPVVAWTPNYSSHGYDVSNARIVLPEISLDFPIDKQRAFQNALMSQRKALGLSQAQMAERIGVDQSVISGIERRVSPRMGWVTFFKIISGYGLPMDYVLEILGVIPMKEDHIDPRIQSIMNTLQGIEDPEWLNFVLTTIEVWLQGATSYLKRLEQ